MSAWHFAVGLFLCAVLFVVSILNWMDGKGLCPGWAADWSTGAGCAIIMFVCLVGAHQ